MLEVSPGLDSKLERNTHLLERVEVKIMKERKAARETYILERPRPRLVRI